MSELTWVDKSTWGPGPWQDEPDKINWTDEATGLPCMIVRGPAGALCGYVGVAEGHPLYRVDYGHKVFPYLEVHGGVTFTDGCQENGDGHGICHIPEPGQPDDVWWIGFDCAHGFDVMPGLESRMRESGMSYIEAIATYKDVRYVTTECTELAAQLRDQAKE